ncbi:hypothetical protein AK812_SmicGene42316 [Symbiodinium microadriaticum]|uniref:Uncharacterized protein n=1 Tax=Symbiodinium microadriaticum TaxID=2951 RepID=A0A1Q9C3Y9_SYMMI|nr:hypothetical protein AK812_SmicGene42316 [Symbiodinium microadriaticum]
MLSRPNGELTRAGQYYYQLIGRPPPSRQYDRNQPLIREGPNDYIMLRGGAKKLLRSLQPNGNYQLTKLGRHFFKDKWVDWVVHVPVIIRGEEFDLCGPDQLLPQLARTLLSEVADRDCKSAKKAAEAALTRDLLIRGRSVCLRAQTKLRTLLQEFKLFYFLTQSEAKWEDWSF